MKQIQKIVDKFNQPDTPLVISAWPERETNHGIAWYTKLTLTEIAKKTGQRFVVLAEKGQDNEPHVYQNGKVLVLRVFDNTHPSLYPTILTWLTKFSAIKQVTIHSEFGVTAGLMHYLFVLPFMALIRLTGRRITYFAHNVIDDISFLSGHLNLADNPMLIDCINLLIRIHARLIARLSDRMVVLDKALERRLNRLLSPLAQQKVVFIPMPIARRNSRYTKTRAKEILNIPTHTKVLLSFGFISSYKGTDWLVNAFNAAGAKTRGVRLIIAGGPAHSLKDRSRYQQYYETVEKRAAENTDILITGYVPENKISLYFQAADLVVLPYRGVMGASGALSHALAYRKPTVLSEAMREYTINNDVQNGLQRARVHMSTVFFPMDMRGMIQILNTVKSAKKLRRLAPFISSLTKARDIVKLTMSTYNELYRQTLQHVSTEQSFQIIRSFLGLSSS